MIMAAGWVVGTLQALDPTGPLSGYEALARHVFDGGAFISISCLMAAMIAGTAHNLCKKRDMRGRL